MREATTAFPDNTLDSSSAQAGDITSEQLYSKTPVGQRNTSMVRQSAFSQLLL